MKQLEAEAAEKTRIEREGLVALSLNIADLFATRTSVSAKFGGAVGDLRGVEVAINLETPLMSDALMHELNPMTVTIGQLTNLPSPLIQSEMMEQTYAEYTAHETSITHAIAFSFAGIEQEGACVCAVSVSGQAINKDPHTPTHKTYRLGP